jgi:hypothetical protein
MSKELPLHCTHPGCNNPPMCELEPGIFYCLTHVQDRVNNAQVVAEADDEKRDHIQSGGQLN